MNIWNQFGLSDRLRRPAKGFSLVETLVAASVVCLAVVAVVAVIRKGQEQMWVENHRRVARGIVNSMIEAPQYSPGNYFSIADGTTPGTVYLDNNNSLQAKDTIRISAESDSGVPYKKIRVKLQWVEPVGGAIDSVAMEKWVPNIPSPNIAPMATAINASSSFISRVCFGWTGANCTGGWSPETYYCGPWSAVDGVIGGRINGDWAMASNDPNPWINFTWAAPRSVFKLVLYDRVNPSYHSTGAVVTFFNGVSQVGNAITVTGIPTGGSKTVYFSPKVIDGMRIVPTGSTDYLGFGEIELY